MGRCAHGFSSLSHELFYRVFCVDALHFIHISILERIGIIANNDGGIVSMKLETFRAELVNSLACPMITKLKNDY